MDNLCKCGELLNECDPYGDDYAYPSCPACGQPIDYCRGHGPSGDPRGFAILRAHDDDDHTRCHPDGCDESGELPESDEWTDSDERANPLLGDVRRAECWAP